jgi:uncharacterized protein YbjT (DUF2867 family)
MAPPIVVLPATGKVGRETVRALQARRGRVRAVSRNAARLASLASDVERAEASLDDLRSLVGVFRGAESAFFVLPYSDQAEALGRNVIEAAREAGLQRLVFAGAYHPDAERELVRRVLVGLTGMFGPHYKPKLRVERMVRGEAFGIVLLPMNFFQNDEVFREQILAGLYTQPLGPKRVNRVDVRDIAEAAAIVLTEPGHEGHAYPVVGLDTLSGPECAAVWSEVLGRHVRYAGDDLGAWAQTVGDRLSAEERTDFMKTYALFQRWGANVSSSVAARTTALLGRPPRRYRDYVRELATRWSRDDGEGT